MVTGNNFPNRFASSVRPPFHGHVLLAMTQLQHVIPSHFPSQFAIYVSTSSHFSSFRFAQFLNVRDNQRQQSGKVGGTTSWACALTLSCCGINGPMLPLRSTSTSRSRNRKLTPGLFTPAILPRPEEGRHLEGMQRDLTAFADADRAHPLTHRLFPVNNHTGGHYTDHALHRNVKTSAIRRHCRRSAIVERNRLRPPLR
jgi:hypothetical protein